MELIYAIGFFILMICAMILCVIIITYVSIFIASIIVIIFLPLIEVSKEILFLLKKYNYGKIFKEKVRGNK